MLLKTGRSQLQLLSIGSIVHGFLNRQVNHTLSQVGHWSQRRGLSHARNRGGNQGQKNQETRHIRQYLSANKNYSPFT